MHVSAHTAGVISLCGHLLVHFVLSYRSIPNLALKQILGRSNCKQLHLPPATNTSDNYVTLHTCQHPSPPKQCHLHNSTVTHASHHHHFQTTSLIYTPATTHHYRNNTSSKKHWLHLRFATNTSSQLRNVYIYTHIHSFKFLQIHP